MGRCIMTHKRKKRTDNKAVTLGDLLNEEIMQQLKDTKKTLAEQEKAKRVAEEERKRWERKEREKNKTFEQLLSESNLDWKQFK